MLDVVESLQSRAVGLFVFVHDALYLVSATPHPDEAKRQDWLAICGRCVCMSRSRLADLSRYDKNVIDARSEPQRADVLRRIGSGELEIVKVTVACDVADVPEMETALRELAGPRHAFHVTRAVEFILELVPTGISKEAAIATLCRTMGIPMSQVLAFGDGSNDRGVRQHPGDPTDFRCSPRSDTASRWAMQSTRRDKWRDIRRSATTRAALARSSSASTDCRARRDSVQFIIAPAHLRRLVTTGRAGSRGRTSTWRGRTSLAAA